jgi:hypothetical protein
MPGWELQKRGKMVKWSEEQYQAHLAKRGKSAHVGVDLAKPRADQSATSKYRNAKLKINGITFDSILEGAYYLELEADLKAGKIEYYLRQVPFRLPGGVAYWCDFMVVPSSWVPARWIDVKGHRTQTFINKVKQVQALYPVVILEYDKNTVGAPYQATAKEMYQMGDMINVKT